MFSLSHQLYSKCLIRIKITHSGQTVSVGSYKNSIFLVSHQLVMSETTPEVTKICRSTNPANTTFHRWIVATYMGLRAIALYHDGYIITMFYIRKGCFERRLLARRDLGSHATSEPALHTPVVVLHFTVEHFSGTFRASWVYVLKVVLFDLVLTLLLLMAARVCIVEDYFVHLLTVVLFLHVNLLVESIQLLF